MMAERGREKAKEKKKEDMKEKEETQKHANVLLLFHLISGLDLVWS